MWVRHFSFFCLLNQIKPASASQPASNGWQGKVFLQLIVVGSSLRDGTGGTGRSQAAFQPTISRTHVHPMACEKNLMDAHKLVQLLVNHQVFQPFLVKLR